MIPSTVTDFHTLGQLYCERLDETGIELPPETSARIALALCDHILDSLSPLQHEAVAQASLYWSGQKAPRLDAVRAALWNEIDLSFGRPVAADAEARRRLVIGAVNTCTPFDGTSSGYLISWGRDAGVQFLDVVEILERYAGDLP